MVMDHEEDYPLDWQPFARLLMKRLAVPLSLCKTGCARRMWMMAVVAESRQPNVKDTRSNVLQLHGFRVQPPAHASEITRGSVAFEFWISRKWTGLL